MRRKPDFLSATARGLRSQEFLWPKSGAGRGRTAANPNVPALLPDSHRFTLARALRLTLDSPRLTNSDAAMRKRLTRAFLNRSVHEVAPDLIGVTLLFAGCGGPIVEVEAYDHTDPAAHSYRGQTARNAVMFGPAGYAYVYRSYGLHWCLNLVCEPAGLAAAVLIRAIEPTVGIARMRRRRGVTDERLLCSGPGRVCEALGITSAHNGLPLDELPFELFARDKPVEVVVGVRIGITKAVDKPWRYGLKGSRFLSKPFPRDDRKECLEKERSQKDNYQKDRGEKTKRRLSRRSKSRVEAEFAARLFDRYRAILVGNVVDTVCAAGERQRGCLRRGVDMERRLAALVLIPSTGAVEQPVAKHDGLHAGC
jgi:DNA-3-methyladenine glycosylase